MGLIQSATTVYARAYLTELGRQYLFDGLSKPRYIQLSNGQTVDRLKIARFSLGDPDVNYNISLPLLSGQIPDLSGENENAVTGAKGRTLDNLISPGTSNIPAENIDSVEYKTTTTSINFNTSTAPSAFPVVITQQLQTFVDGSLINDGVYIVSPTSYGPNVLNNNELIITLKQPTTTSPGYRLRIFYPTTGSNYNKVTFQFEKANQVQGVPTTSVITGISPLNPNAGEGRAIVNLDTATNNNAG
jgi:hypothetical protein